MRLLLLLVLGILGGATLVGYAYLIPACAPVTVDTEVFCSRIWTPALLGMTLGFVGIRTWALPLVSPNARSALAVVAGGAAVMTFGNAAEYWLFFGWPHEGPDGWLRGTLWMSFLLGWLLVLVGAIAAGILMFGRRNPMAARLLGSLLISMASLTVFVGLFAVPALAIVTSAYVLVASLRSPGGAAAEGA